MQKLSSLEVGHQAENEAERSLLMRYPPGTSVLERNWRRGSRCELDRILWVPTEGLLVFVEIRFRSQRAGGRFSALESLSFAKRRHLQRSIRSYLMTLSAQQRKAWGLAGLRVDLWFGSQVGWEILSGLELPGKY